METSNSSTLIEFINATAPAFVGGIVAIAGALTVFALQQAAERRTKKEQLFETAFERFMTFCAFVANTIDSGPRAGKGFSRWEVYDHGWRFIWALPKRDRVVGQWAMTVIVGSLEALGDSKQDREARLEVEKNMNLTVTFLDKWRQGVMKRDWFEEQLKKHGFQDQAPPTIGPKKSADNSQDTA